MKTPNIREAINQALSKYQVTIEELEEVYPRNKNNEIMVDGLVWYDYFYVPKELQDEVVEKWEKAYKQKFSLGWMYMPTARIDTNFSSRIIGDQTLINNRNELLKAWE